MLGLSDVACTLEKRNCGRKTEAQVYVGITPQPLVGNMFRDAEHQDELDTAPAALLETLRILLCSARAPHRGTKILIEHGLRWDASDPPIPVAHGIYCLRALGRR